jgi:hypothetical protein
MQSSRLGLRFSISHVQWKLYRSNSKLQQKAFKARVIRRSGISDPNLKWPGKFCINWRSLETADNYPLLILGYVNA